MSIGSVAVVSLRESTFKRSEFGLFPGSVGRFRRWGADPCMTSGRALPITMAASYQSHQRSGLPALLFSVIREPYSQKRMLGLRLIGSGDATTESPRRFSTLCSHIP